MSENRDTKNVIKLLKKEGWIARQGKGDHINFSKPGVNELITVDTGKKEISKPIYNKISKQAGWK